MIVFFSSHLFVLLPFWNDFFEFCLYISRGNIPIMFFSSFFEEIFQVQKCFFFWIWKISDRKCLNLNKLIWNLCSWNNSKNIASKLFLGFFSLKPEILKLYRKQFVFEICTFDVPVSLFFCLFFSMQPKAGIFFAFAVEEEESSGQNWAGNASVFSPIDSFFSLFLSLSRSFILSLLHLDMLSDNICLTSTAEIQRALPFNLPPPSLSHILSLSLYHSLFSFSFSFGSRTRQNCLECLSDGLKQEAGMEAKRANARKHHRKKERKEPERQKEKAEGVVSMVCLLFRGHFSFPIFASLHNLYSS